MFIGKVIKQLGGKMIVIHRTSVAETMEEARQAAECFIAHHFNCTVVTDGEITKTDSQLIYGVAGLEDQRAVVLVREAVRLGEDDYV